jgi:large subunit ribosomal protein L17
MMRNLVTSLIVHERVTTTDMKAKELRRVAERLVTKAARVSGLASKDPKRLSQEDRAKLVHARRVVARHVRLRGSDREQQDVDVLWKLFTEIGPRFSERAGGYLRITKLPNLRKGDGAPLSIVEFVERAAEAGGEEGAAAGAGSAGGKEARGGLLRGLLRGRRKKAKPEPEQEEDEEEEEDGEDEEDEKK